MIIVSGGAGFIGSNIIHGLNERSCDEILVVDAVDEDCMRTRLKHCRIADYMHKDRFREVISSGDFWPKLDAIIHQGACSDTLEDNVEYMIDNNVQYSKAILEFAQLRRAPLVYASTAAVYGNVQYCGEEPRNEKPLNIYGLSKLMFDCWVRQNVNSYSIPVVGLRYFNVYGPGEEHKGRMASVVHRFAKQAQETGVISLFQGSGGYSDGEQRRDFVYVGDVVKANLYFIEHPSSVGIYNCGTGDSWSFNQVARAVMSELGRGHIEYVSFPPGLKERYQSFTCADITALRSSGYRERFVGLAEGVAATLQCSCIGLRETNVAEAAVNDVIRVSAT